MDQGQLEQVVEILQQELGDKPIGALSYMMKIRLAVRITDIVQEREPSALAQVMQDDYYGIDIKVHRPGIVPYTLAN